MVRAGESMGADVGIERLAAQAAVADRLNGGRWQIVGEFVEVETRRRWSELGLCESEQQPIGGS